MSERETARQLAAALREVVETFGPWHDDDCPGDDTCDCSAKPLHDRVNAALRASGHCDLQRAGERCEWCKYSFIPTRRGKQRQRFCCPHCAQSWLAANRGADVVDRLKAQARAIEAILRASGCPSMPLSEGVQWLANRVPESAGADPVPVCQWHDPGEDDSEWQTGCGKSFTFIDDGPVENGVKFCPYCGKPLTLVPAEGENHD